MEDNERHYVRGVILAVILGAPFLFLASNFLWIAVTHWLEQNVLSNWFSDSGNAADWLWGTGGKGDVAAYVGLAANGVPAMFLGYAIRRGFIGSSKSRN